MAADFYKTILGSSEALHRVSASKHLAFVFHVRTEEEIKSHIDRLRKEHHTANHVCYAWRLGWDKSRYRINDDGEPSGTAGKPIYGQLLSYDLTNVLIAVVRYFGGTKLGTGGLIDAYKTASKLAIDSAVIVEKPVLDHYQLTFKHEDMPAVMKFLKEIHMEKLMSDFTEACRIEFNAAMAFRERIETEVENWKEAELLHLGRN